MKILIFFLCLFSFVSVSQAQKRRVRVEWSIIGSTNAKANTIKSAIDTCLSGKATQKVLLTNNRDRTTVSGDQRFNIDAEGETAFTCIQTQALGANAVAGSYVETHRCDHDLNEQGTVGLQCDPASVVRSEK